jgi:PadR family transcriptional regulator, regulatory protein PadR
MDASESLGSFEQLVLLAIARLGDRAYGMTVRTEIETGTDRVVSLGAVYATIERLEKKGYLSTSLSSGGPEREGRARRLVRIETTGMQALRRSLEVLDRMRVDLSGLQPAMVRR